MEQTMTWREGAMVNPIRMPCRYNHSTVIGIALKLIQDLLNLVNVSKFHQSTRLIINFSPILICMIRKCSPHAAISAFAKVSPFGGKRIIGLNRLNEAFHCRLLIINLAPLLKKYVSMLS